MAVPHQFHSLALPGYRLAVCRSAADIQICSQMYQAFVEKPEYGVIVPEKVQHYREPMARFTWVGAWEEGTGRLIGTFRLDDTVDLSRYPNLTPFAHQYRRSHRVVDVGAHLLPQGRVRGTVFEGLFTVTLHYLVATEIAGVYIQVQPGQVRVYSTLGFQVVTAPFQPLGFGTWWQGMLLCLETLTVLWAEPVFQQSWQRQTGTMLRVAFWRRVIRRLPEVKIRTTRKLVVDVVTEHPVPVPGPKNSKKSEPVLYLYLPPGELPCKGACQIL